MVNHISKKNKLIASLAGLCVLFPLSCWGSESEISYLCVSEDSTGFYFENGKWDRTQFNTDDEKFIIRKMKPDEVFFKENENRYGVYDLGENIASRRCNAPSEHTKDIICKAGIGELYFSPESGRFIKTYIAGYWDGSDDNDNTPNITRGRCSRI